MKRQTLNDNDVIKFNWEQLMAALPKNKSARERILRKLGRTQLRVWFYPKLEEPIV